MKKEKKESERERSIEIDSPKKGQILAFAHMWKTKKLFHYVRLVGKYVFFLEKLVFSQIYAH